MYRVKRLNPVTRRSALLAIDRAGRSTAAALGHEITIRKTARTGQAIEHKVRSSSAYVGRVARRSSLA